MPESDDNTVIIAYLLGRLDPPAKERFEERYFTDNALFDQVEVVEHELLEEYLDNRLLSDRRKALEKRLRQSPHRRTRLEYLRAVRERGKAPATARPSRGHRWALAPAVAVVVVAASLGVLLWTENHNLQRQLDEYARLPREGPAASQGAASDPVAHVSVEAAALARSRSASPGPANVRRKRDAAVVEISLSYLKSAISPKTAALLNADGEELASQSKLIPTATDGVERVTVTFPASLLPQGSYVLRLQDSHGGTIESFAFNVFVE